MSLFIVQPKLAAYRLPVYYGMGKIDREITVFHEGGLDGGSTKIKNCDSILIKRQRLFKGYYQKRLLSSILSKKPNSVFFYADLKNVTLWLTLMLSKFQHFDVFLHGQGIFKKTKVSYFEKIIWRFALSLCTKFIGYNNFVTDEMKRVFPYQINKIVACNNTLEDPVLKLYQPKFKLNVGILFIGRIRENVNIELLINAVTNINAHQSPEEQLHLHIIGGGEALAGMKTRWSEDKNISWHGKLYDNSDIASIAENCSIGIYPGDGGLSVVHYMSLGLLPIVHNEWKKHMGPEPWYVTEISKNYFFQRDDQTSLKQAIENAFDDSHNLLHLRRRSREYFESLSDPAYSMRLMKIITKRNL